MIALRKNVQDVAIQTNRINTERDESICPWISAEIFHRTETKSIERHEAGFSSLRLVISKIQKRASALQITVSDIWDTPVGELLPRGITADRRANSLSAYLHGNGGWEWSRLCHVSGHGEKVWHVILFAYVWYSSVHTDASRNHKVIRRKTIGIQISFLHFPCFSSLDIP